MCVVKIIEVAFYLLYFWSLVFQEGTTSSMIRVCVIKILAFSVSTAVPLVFYNETASSKISLNLVLFRERPLNYMKTVSFLL